MGYITTLGKIIIKVNLFFQVFFKSQGNMKWSLKSKTKYKVSV